MTTADDLFDLLPAHLRTRDEGLLRALLAAIAAEATVLDDDIRALYDDWFVETARPWALPYLADLLGVDDLPDTAGRRAIVANTIEYRRRKGTIAAAEQVVRDAAAAPARAVESFRLLSTTTHVKHVRLDRVATADVRGADERSSPLVARGSFDPSPHIAEARRIARGRGRYGIGNVGVFSFGTTVFQVTDAVAAAGSDVWWVHPLGVPRPLFSPPVAEDGFDQRADEAELAMPLRPRRLLALLHEVRKGLREASELPVGVTVKTVAGALALGSDRLRVARLEDLSDDGDVAGWRAMVDAVNGFVALYRDGVKVMPGDPGVLAVLVSHGYGGRPGVGGEPYDHSIVHERALAGDGYIRAREVPVVAQRSVPLTDGGDLAGALRALADGWQAGPESNTAGSTSVLSVGDSGEWKGDLAATIPSATRLVLVGARWGASQQPDVAAPVPGVYAAGDVRPVVRGNVEITGVAGSALLIDGLTIVGDLIVHADGMLAVTICQATVTGTVRVDAAGSSGARGLTVRILSSAVGGVDLAETAPAVSVADSIVSADVGGQVISTPAIAAPGAHMSVEASTVRGSVTARTLSCTDVLFDGVVRVLHRQVGCARYSYFGEGSLTPHRFRCVPASDSDDPPAVLAFCSDRAGDPVFLELSEASHMSVRQGSETGDEIGVDAGRRRPTTIAAAARLLTGVLPVGIDSFVWSAR